MPCAREREPQLEGGAPSTAREWGAERENQRHQTPVISVDGANYTPKSDIDARNGARVLTITTPKEVHVHGWGSVTLSAVATKMMGVPTMATTMPTLDAWGASEQR